MVYTYFYPPPVHFLCLGGGGGGGGGGWGWQLSLHNFLHNEYILEFNILGLQDFMIKLYDIDHHHYHNHPKKLQNPTGWSQQLLETRRNRLR